jgi:hypothetical protein
MVCEGDWVGLRKNVLGSPEISDVLNICRDLSSCLEGYRMEDDHLNGMPEEGTQAYNELMEETGGAAAYDTFDFEAHLAATSGIQTDPDDSPTPAPEGSRPVDFDDPSHAADEQTGYESRFDSEDEAIEWAEANGQGQLSRDDSGILRNQFGEEMVSDSDGNLAPRPFDPNSEFPPEPPPMFFPDDDSPVDPSNPEFAVPMPPIGSLEYEALLFETGGASANPGFNYQAHLAATGQLDKLLELDPSYNPDLDPSFDGDFEAPFDEFSPESAIDRDALVNATSFEAFLAASNGVDVGALGGLLTPAEIAEVVARFGDDPEFDAFVAAPPSAGPQSPRDPSEFNEETFNSVTPPAFLPSEDRIQLIRGGGRDDKKTAVLDLFSEAGSFDAFAAGLTSTLSAGEIDALIAELADDSEVWATLGIDMPPMPARPTSDFAIPMPPIGSLEYEALLFETGGASANPGFNYQAHLAATGQLDKLLELDPSYNPDLDPSFDGDFEAPFDEFSPESAIDRDALVNATSFEAFLAASNGVDVGALGGLLTPSEIAEVVARFGDDPSFQTFIGAPVNATVEEPDPELLEESVPLPPTVFIPPEEKLGLIRGGGREEKKAAVLDLFSEAGNFDLFANGLAATLSADEINALIRELADDDAVWETLGIEKPVLSEESDRIAGDSVDVPVETSPVFTPRDEDLNVLRTANKEAKKGAIFELLDESGSVDAFLGGLGSSLAPSEIESLAIEFAEDGDIWEALGIPQPEFDLEVPAGSEGLNDELPLDAPLSAEDLMLVGLGDPVVS